MGEISFFPENLEVKNKKIILRLDFNVPLKDRAIKDGTRINLCLPFINQLIKKKAKIIIISHLGRPKGIRNPELSLTPIYKYLKKKLETNVFFFRGNFDEETNVEYALLIMEMKEQFLKYYIENFTNYLLHVNVKPAIATKNFKKN